RTTKFCRREDGKIAIRESSVTGTTSYSHHAMALPTNTSKPTTIVKQPPMKRESTRKFLHQRPISRKAVETTKIMQETKVEWTKENSLTAKEAGLTMPPPPS
ncbi:unnamed protein product, partial [Ilex paraguariensis]